MNPFIELARDPVAFFGTLAYATLMLTLAVAGTLYVLREYTMLYVTASRDHRNRDWWGDAANGWLPPAAWSARAIKATFVLVVDFWALAAILWFLT